jgi:hypothetical protein
MNSARREEKRTESGEFETASGRPAVYTNKLYSFELS